MNILHNLINLLAEILNITHIKTLNLISGLCSMFSNESRGIFLWIGSTLLPF